VNKVVRGVLYIMEASDGGKAGEPIKYRYEKSIKSERTSIRFWVTNQDEPYGGEGAIVERYLNRSLMYAGALQMDSCWKKEGGVMVMKLGSCQD
jgi:hypothetical protein